MSTVDKENHIREYLKNSTVLIVDYNASARIALKKVLVAMGAPIMKTELASSNEEAEAIIKKVKPNIVFCDYKVGNSYGLDLLQKQKEEHPKETNNCIFILVTSNTSQSAVAQAAEEDIDSFILKPYTIESFTSALHGAIMLKQNPNDYLKLINQGKELLDQNAIDEAIKQFEVALSKDDKPSLACFYKGMAHLKQQKIENSEASYKNGLNYNKLHYKCLTGLYELLLSLKKYDAAYEIVQEIVRFFPNNTKKISGVFRLAIQTKNYADIEIFYEEFKKIEGRNDEIIKCWCAALIVCAKHFFEEKNEKSAFEFIAKAVASATGNHSILRNVVHVLAQHGQINMAEDVLKRFSKPTPADSIYAISQFLITSKSKDIETIINEGVALIKRGIQDPYIYQTTIDSYIKYGKSERAEEFLVQAQKKYSNVKAEIKKAA